jgi:hypothetical protein
LHKLRDFCTMHGIDREHTIRDTPQQNGVAERMNRTLYNLPSAPSPNYSTPTSFTAHLNLAIQLAYTITPLPASPPPIQHHFPTFPHLSSITNHQNPLRYAISTPNPPAVIPTLLHHFLPYPNKRDIFRLLWTSTIPQNQSQDSRNNLFRSRLSIALSG